MDQAETLKENCLFCHIVEGKVPSRKVFEDDLVIGILDINPANAGHVLLMPKEHYLFMPQVPEGVLSRVFSVARLLSQAALRAVRSDGTTIFVANGGVAGQRAPHFMVHVIPRISGDGLALSVPENRIAPEVQSQVKAQLRSALGLLGKDLHKAIESKAHGKAEIQPETAEAKAHGKAKIKSDVVKSKEAQSKPNLDSITEMLAGGKNG